MKGWGQGNRRLYAPLKGDRDTDPWMEIRRLKRWLRFYAVACLCLLAYILFRK